VWQTGEHGARKCRKSNPAVEKEDQATETEMKSGTKQADTSSRIPLCYGCDKPDHYKTDCPKVKKKKDRNTHKLFRLSKSEGEPQLQYAEGMHLWHQMQVDVVLSGIDITLSVGIGNNQG